MRKFSKKQVAAAVVAGAVVVGGAGTAFAYWTSSGTGDGSATTGTSSNFVVNVDTNTAKNLTPGGPTNTINFSVKNTNSGVQKLQTVTAAIANTDGSAWTSGNCSASDFSVGAPSFTVQELANNASAAGTFTIQMINRVGVNQDDCKNVTVPLHADAG